MDRSSYARFNANSLLRFRGSESRAAIPVEINHPEAERNIVRVKATGEEHPRTVSSSVISRGKKRNEFLSRSAVVFETISGRSLF